MPRQVDAAAIDGIIAAHLERLRKPGVVSVRPGYEISDHRLTGRMAIVATVHTKRARLHAGEALPATLGGVAVDVRQATPLQRLRALDPRAAELARAYARPEESAPPWPYERTMPDGALVPTGAASPVAQKPRLAYTAPPGRPLRPVSLTSTVVAGVSPDSGLQMLDAFLQSTASGLQIAMYDFTSASVLAAILQALAPAPRTLQMVLDNPPPVASADQTDTRTAADLAAHLGGRAQIARALTRTDVYAAAWIFPSAYHIKAIVRDGAAVWLSSGNLDDSNLPDPAHPPLTQDRDWHVIVEDAGLAALFGAYLRNDFDVASAHQQGASAGLPRAVREARRKLAEQTDPPRPPASADQRAAAVVAPATFAGVALTVTPLLTPDRQTGSASGEYLDRIVALVASAQRSLYIQMQYVETPAEDAASGFKSLLAAVLERIKSGIDVRIIESQQYGEAWAEKMKSMPDVDLTPAIRLQPDVHNKGIVVDSRIVVVSSQNWSAEGVQENRDAGLIIENAQIAAYYEQVFLADWSERAAPFAAPAGRRKA